MPHRVTWSIALVGVTAVWGWSFAAKHEILTTMQPSNLNAYMFGLAAVAVLPFSTGSLRDLRARDWVGGLIAGVVLFVAFTLQTSGMAHTSPSNAGFITGLCTVITPVILFLIGRGRPRFNQALGIVIAVVGLGLLSLDEFAIHYGDLLILGCAVAFALHIVTVSIFTTAAAANASTFLQLGVVGLLSLALSLANKEFSLPSNLPITVNILVIAVFATALAYTIQTRAQVILAPEKVALILICEPLFAGLFGYFYAGDRLSSEKLLGGGLILIGIAVSELCPNKAATRVI